MKKLFFGLACVIGLMFFASCTQEVIDDLMSQKPTVEFVAEEGYISGNTGMYLGDTLKFKVKVAPNSGSEAALSHFDFSVTDLSGDTYYNDNPEIEKPSEENLFEYKLSPNYPSTFVVTASITDVNGKVNLIKVVVDYVQPVVEGIGTFSGNLNINGHLTSNEIAGQQAYDQDYNLENLATTLTLGAVDEGNNVSATLDIDGTPVTIYGTMTDGNITFDEFIFNKTINLFVDVTLNLTMNMTGVLENDVLTLSGTATGQGKTQVFLVFLEVNYDGTIEGSLEKVVE